MDINYYTLNPMEDYVKALNKAQSAKDLVNIVLKYGKVTEEALECARKMTDESVLEMQSMFIKVNLPFVTEQCQNEFNERFAPIYMPQRLIISSMLADEMKVNWGTAWMELEKTDWEGYKEEVTEA